MDIAVFWMVENTGWNVDFRFVGGRLFLQGAAKEGRIILGLFIVQNYLTLLDDEDHTLENLKIQDEQQLVIEGTTKVSDPLSIFQRWSPFKT